MTESWFDPLNEAFEIIAGERKGEVVRKAGVLSTETEILFQKGSWPVVFGFDLSVPGSAQLTLYVRIARMPATPAAAVEYVGLGAAESSGPPAVFVPNKPATSHPGFHLHYQRPSHFVDAWLQRLVGPTVKLDRSRPGWLQVSSSHRPHIVDRLEGSISRAFGRLVDGDPADLTVILTPFVYRVRQRPVPLDAVLLMSFLDDGLSLLETAIEAHPPLELDMTEIEELPATVVVSSGWCGICGEEARERRVACSRCKAPHHRECWGWIGQCAIFGCGSRRFVG